MPKLKHFVITMFNLKLYKADKSNTTIEHSDWLDDRFRLFETYTLPSMKQQSCQDYIWMMLFDSKTDEKYLKLMEDYKKDMPNIVVEFIDESVVEDWRNVIKDILRKYIDDDDEFIVTTNIDNDDSFHKDAVKLLQDEVNKRRETGLYVIYHGLQYFVDKDMVVKMTYPHNHFLTYVDTNRPGFLTTDEYRHARWRKVAEHIVDIKDRPYWIEVVHSRNVNNDLRITSRIRYTVPIKPYTLSDYGLDVRHSLLHNLKDAFVCFPWFVLKTIPGKLKRKLRKKK